MSEAGREDWSPAERALLDAALDFYGAAEAAIEYGGAERPRVRRDPGKLAAVRTAMAQLETHILRAHEAGVAPAAIAQITRLEPEIIERMLAANGVAGADGDPDAEPFADEATSPTGG